MNKTYSNIFFNFWSSFSLMLSTSSTYTQTMRSEFIFWETRSTELEQNRKLQKVRLLFEYVLKAGEQTRKKNGQRNRRVKQTTEKCAKKIINGEKKWNKMNHTFYT